MFTSLQLRVPPQLIDPQLYVCRDQNQQPQPQQQQAPVNPNVEIKPKSGKIVKCKFTPEEDQKLKELVQIHGTSSWKLISSLMGTRNHRQCRERYKNYLDPNLRNDPWTFEEDHLLVDKFAEYGPRWNKIAKFFTNRSDNSLRNRWQLMLRQWERQNSEKKQGIDLYQNTDLYDNVTLATIN
ncbi:Myb-like DNA-binding domain containing protein [Histomonas meleagridis]|uniref:Myb-like DNA-binding domain containing protein n=1 Tax=Histomonas meleagridis TaxID=135588 RepID=UPI00355AAF82|nr:Myb-like DNA-binding domain containing protein [Histomonas meleagridis]KAH0797614.1 Myb-like DNA-binding domain containing protein [Histomonas meleagridis]